MVAVSDFLSNGPGLCDSMSKWWWLSLSMITQSTIPVLFLSESHVV